MKTKLSVAFIAIFMILFSLNSAANGFYGNGEKTETVNQDNSSSKMLKARPDDGEEGNPGTGEPGTDIPGGSGLYVLLGVAGIYMIKIYRDSKKQKA